MNKILCVLSIAIMTACNSANFSTKSSSNRSGGTCVEGKRLAVWLDRNQDGNNSGEPLLGTFVAYSGGTTGAANYNYFSDSAHPLIGPSPVGFKSTIFFYEGTDGLSFSFFSNIDEGGSADNIVEWDIHTKDNALLDLVRLSDDGSELKHDSQDSNSKKYLLRSHYWSNTDGGVIGPFEGEDFQISVRVFRFGDNIDAGFYSANGDILPLRDGTTAVSSFIVGYAGYETCQ